MSTTMQNDTERRFSRALKAVRRGKTGEKVDPLSSRSDHRVSSRNEIDPLLGRSGSDHGRKNSYGRTPQLRVSSNNETDPLSKSSDHLVKSTSARPPQTLREEGRRPSERRLDRRPSERRIERRPSERRIERLPSERRMERRPSERRMERRPSERRLEGPPSSRKQPNLSALTDEEEKVRASSGFRGTTRESRPGAFHAYPEPVDRSESHNPSFDERMYNSESCLNFNPNDLGYHDGDRPLGYGSSNDNHGGRPLRGPPMHSLEERRHYDHIEDHRRTPHHEDRFYDNYDRRPYPSERNYDDRYRHQQNYRGYNESSRRSSYGHEHEDFRCYDQHGGGAGYSRHQQIHREPERMAHQENMVEIFPGHSVPLRTSEQTMEAVSKDFFIPFECMACGKEILCIADASYCICPTCKGISQLDNPDLPESAKYGLGLGFSYETLFEMQSDIMNKRRR